MTDKKKFDPSNKLYCPCCGVQNCDTADVFNIPSEDCDDWYCIVFECFNCDAPITIQVEVTDITPFTDKEFIS